MSRARDTADQINRINSSAADATAITVTSSEKIGIGTDAPTGKLTVRSSVGGGEALTVSSSNSGANYITHKHYSSGDIAYIGAGGGAAVSAGTSNDYAIRANSGSLIFATGGNNERARLDGDGLKFNGDTAAANALNDYEEGTWTLTQGAQGTWNSPTFVGKYTKIGQLVTVTIEQNAGTISYSKTYYGGLPFPVSTTTHGYKGVGGASNGNIDDLGGIMAFSGTTQIYVLTAGSNQTNLIFSITYHTDS